MKKVFWLILSSFLVLGACSHSSDDSKQNDSKSTQKDSKSNDNKTVKKVKNSAKRKTILSHKMTKEIKNVLTATKPISNK